MARVHVLGASGYASAEAIRILERHPLVELHTLESASHAGESVAAHFPALRKSARRFDGPGSVAAAIVAGDVVIMGGSNGNARAHAPAFVASGARVIDLSADFRSDARAIYGLSERYRELISTAQLIANPGCYPTAALLALLPLSHMPVVQIVIDAKSGVTGAGRTPSVGALFAEVAGDIRAYGLGGHRHEPEIAQELKALGCEAPFVFTPHVVPLCRGMLVDAYAMFAEPPDEAAIHAAYERAYAGEPFVRVLPNDRAPCVAAVVGTNDAELNVSIRGNVVRAICAIDNLGKGAAGQAVQNLNIMLGFPEECGLDERAVVNY
jgi:N-acetyl-gamma-glutamyl-phosphate reductase